jgi:hypothetical protein
VDVADPRDARGCLLPSISSRKASTEPRPLTPFLRGGGVFIALRSTRMSHRHSPIR